MKSHYYSLLIISYISLIYLSIKALSFIHNPYNNIHHFNNINNKRSRSRSIINLNMVFDFLRKRTEEGIAQVQNIASKAAEGKLGEALLESAQYIQTRQRIDAENLRRLTDGLARSRDRLLTGISGAVDNSADSIDSQLEKLEDVLLQADIGSKTSSQILQDLRSYARREGLKKDDVLPILRKRLIEALTIEDNKRAINFQVAPDGSKIPTVLFIIGANGMGKTTTIGKLAYRLKNEANMTVILGACDTFRAAAVEQLNEWANRANVSIEVPLESERGGDPVPVVTRTIQRGLKEQTDVIIIDTSGRLSNNFELIQQLQDMKAAIQKEIPSAPHETLLVVDGSVGRNAVDQASAWRKYVGVTGLAITKLDGTARGGFVVAVVKDLGIPVKFIGVGEKIEDLRDFQPEIFVDALLGNDEDAAKVLESRAKKMLNIVASDEDADMVPTKGGGTGISQLKATFDSNSNDNDYDDNESPNKPKRAKRPKPQKVVQKKK